MPTHVVPENDEMPHIDDIWCWCSPIVLYRHPGTGEDYDDPPKVLHNSADCREVCEALTGECMDEQHRWLIIHT